MCLSTVYDVTDGGKEKICEYVSSVRAGDGTVVLVDIMGIEKTVPGIIRSMDLVNNEIIISAKER